MHQNYRFLLKNKLKKITIITDFLQLKNSIRYNKIKFPPHNLTITIILNKCLGLLKLKLNRFKTINYYLIRFTIEKNTLKLHNNK